MACGGGHLRADVARHSGRTVTDRSLPMNRRRLLPARVAWPVVALLLAALALPAAAQPPADAPGGARMKAVDTDGDGAISRDEAAAALHAEFRRLDRDHDGALREDEFVAARLERFSAADADGDGKLTRAELRQRARAARGS
ncbi:EF-hand domain-containing protein [Solimonas variicoloris]|uniref:EF-hand domain-containing protein n=1 Tax=Solimonas variicoloris TaxID=254408 RepID=UPI0012B5B614|nr:EF-hand domain-containing protein [Solimonas variicoloris]